MIFMINISNKLTTYVEIKKMLLNLQLDEPKATSNIWACKYENMHVRKKKILYLFLIRILANTNNNKHPIRA